MGDKRSLSLKEELAKHIGETVLIGVRSSFFFIGPCEEAISDLNMLGLMSKCCVALSMNKSIEKTLSSPIDDIGCRSVSKVYKRNMFGNEDTVILIHGREFGAYWTRAEYLAGRQALCAELENREAASRKSASV